MLALVRSRLTEDGLLVSDVEVGAAQSSFLCEVDMINLACAVTLIYFNHIGFI